MDAPAAFLNAQTSIIRRGSDATLLIAYNSDHQNVPFILPEVAEGRHWFGLIDTAKPWAPVTAFELGQTYELTGRLLSAFALPTDTGITSGLRQGVSSILDLQSALSLDIRAVTIWMNAQQQRACVCLDSGTFVAFPRRTLEMQNAAIRTSRSPIWAER